MTAILAFVAGGWLLCACIVTVLVFTAPHGWEDEDGFHEGRKPEHGE